MEAEKAFKLKACVVGMLFSFIVMILLSLAGAVVFKITPVSENIIKPISYLLLGISCFTGGIISSKATGKRGALSGAVTGVLFLAAILALQLVSTGDVSASGKMMIPSIVILASSLFGGIFGVNLK